MKRSAIEYLREGVSFLSKLGFWTVFFFFISQLFHEFGHMWAGLLAGYRINYITMSLSGSHVNMTITSPSTLLYQIVLFAGGFTSVAILSIIYSNIKDLGAEFSIIALSFIQIEAVTAIVEALFNTFYKGNFVLMNILALPAFIIAVYLHRDGLPRVHTSAV